MNFDVNTISTLMQMFSAMKPPASESPKMQDDASVGKGGENVSVFAMQNGLGERVDIGGSKKSENKKSSPQGAAMGNPMAAMLEMMTGSKAQGGSGDMLSTLMPMLMNVMGGRQTGAQANKTAQNSSNNFGGDQSVGNQNQSANNQNQRDNSNSRQSSSEEVEKSNNKNNCKPKPQPTHDKYEPIAFAGYTLISALNKLYIAKRI